VHETIDFWIITGDGRRHWVAMISQDGQRYSGDGSTPWEAVAWALDERAHRRLGIVRMCHVAGAKPTLTPDPKLVATVTKEHAEHAEEERKRLPLAEAPCTKSKSAAARRARSKKSAKPGASH
jgi:hypothetical protein